MSRTIRFSVSALFLLAVLPVATSAQEEEMEFESPDRDAIIEEATSAAPASITADATVMDLEGNVLREGTNGFTCLPDLPGDENYEPMCNDAEWMTWVHAFMNGEEPEVDGLGVSYMLSSKWAVSNVDPEATEPTPDNEWVEGGAHLMLIVPDPAMLEGYPDDPGPGPYVMWKGTPYVHLMVPMEDLVEKTGN